MNCDSYFEIGSSHLICQDYTLTGTYRDMAYGIVSDGCSSAEFSETGAQILCHASKYYIALYHDLFFSSTGLASITNLLANSIRTRADEIRKIYPISRDSLQATLLISLMFKPQNMPVQSLVFIWGDGVFIKSAKGVVEVIEIDYPETNAPVYLTTDMEAYKNKFGIDKLVKRIRKYNFISNSIQNVVEEQILIDTPCVFQSSVDINDFVIITTDGLSQYQDQNKKPIQTELLVPQIMDYPSFKGQFVKRTMNFMKRDLIKKSWSHADDIGIATLICD